MTRPRSRRGTGEQLRRALLDAATELLHTRSLDELSVRTVTGATGVSPTALYLHFAELADLLHAAKQEIFGELGATLGAAAGHAGGPADALRAVAAAYLEFAARRPGHYAAIFHVDGRGGEPAEPPATVVEAGLLALQPLQLAVGAVLGADATDTEIYETTLDVWVALHGRAHLAMTLPWFDLPDRARFVDRTLAGLLR